MEAGAVVGAEAGVDGHLIPDSEMYDVADSIAPAPPRPWLLSSTCGPARSGMQSPAPAVSPVSDSWVHPLVLVDPDMLIGLLGVSAVLTGLLRVLGGFAAEERLGHRWTLGGIVLCTLEVALGVLLH